MDVSRVSSALHGRNYTKWPEKCYVLSAYPNIQAQFFSFFSKSSNFTYTITIFTSEVTSKFNNQVLYY